MSEMPGEIDVLGWVAMCLQVPADAVRTIDTEVRSGGVLVTRYATPVGLVEVRTSATGIDYGMSLELAGPGPAGNPPAVVATWRTRGILRT